MTVLIVASFPDSILKFRGALIDALLASDCTVHVAAPDLQVGSDTRVALEGKGVHIHNIALRRTGMNPLSDMVTLLSLWELMLRIRPKMVLSYTIKPVIYGSLAARLACVPYHFVAASETACHRFLVRGWRR